MKKEYRIRLDNLVDIIYEKELELKKVRKELEIKDTERYKVWNELIAPYYEKINVIKNNLEELYMERSKLEILEDHKKHKWEYDTQSFGNEFTRYKCKICGKTKQKRSEKNKEYMAKFRITTTP